MLPMLGALAIRAVPWGKIIVGLVILGLGVACWVFWERAATARDAQAVAERAAELAAADATRWQAAAEQNAAVINQQNAAIEAQRVDLQRARTVIAAAEAENLSVIAGMERQINQWKERARANPADVVPLGRISRDAVRVLVAP